MRENKCYVCGQNASIKGSQYFLGDAISCSRCGKFIIEESVFSYFEGEEGYKYASSLAYYFMHYKKKNGKVYLIVDSEEENEKYNTLSINEILNLYPKTFSEKIDKILLSWDTFYDPDSVYITFGDLLIKYYAIFFIRYNPFMENNANTYREIVEQIKILLEIMVEQELIKTKTGNNSYTINYKGWQRIDELQKQNNTKNQGFIAMWFDPQMNEIEVAIKEAILENGYIPMKIDEKEHNNQIVPELLYEIKSSDFLVADLTGNRGGVYYEAGYAYGLGKEVIILVKDMDKKPEDMTDEEKLKYIPHFDVAQKSQVRYKTPEELKEKLIKRIRATAGDRSKEMH